MIYQLEYFVVNYSSYELDLPEPLGPMMDVK